jgi:hypothetical protein
VYAILPRLHFLLEYVNNFEQSLDDIGRPTRDFAPLLSPGFRGALVNEQNLQIVAGAAAPIGLNHNAANFGALLYFSVEHKLF